MKHTKRKLKAIAHISVYKDDLREQMDKRSDVADQILDLAITVFDKDEVRKLSTLLSDLILGPLYKVQYKTQMSDDYKEYPILGKTQIRRRKAREVLTNGREYREY